MLQSENAYGGMCRTYHGTVKSPTDVSVTHGTHSTPFGTTGAPANASSEPYFLCAAAAPAGVDSTGKDDAPENHALTFMRHRAVYEWWVGKASAASGGLNVMRFRTGEANALRPTLETNVVAAGTVTAVTPGHSERTFADTWSTPAGTTARPARCASAAVSEGSHGTHSSDDRA